MKKKWQSKFSFETIDHYIRLGFYIHFDPEEKYGGVMNDGEPRFEWYGKEFDVGLSLFKFHIGFSLTEIEDKEVENDH
jgi:hypothetical protein